MVHEIVSCTNQLEDDTTILDHGAMDAAVRYLVSQQHKDGSFSPIGWVHNYRLLVSLTVIHCIIRV